MHIAIYVNVNETKNCRQKINSTFGSLERPPNRKEGFYLVGGMQDKELHNFRLPSSLLCYDVDSHVPFVSIILNGAIVEPSEEMMDTGTDRGSCHSVTGLRDSSTKTYRYLLRPSIVSPATQACVEIKCGYFRNKRHEMKDLQHLECCRSFGIQNSRWV